jgi:hypothetical protein
MVRSRARGALYGESVANHARYERLDRYATTAAAMKSEAERAVQILPIATLGTRCSSMDPKGSRIR